MSCHKYSKKFIPIFLLLVSLLTPHSFSQQPGISCRVAFSPRGDAQETILKELKRARYCVDVGMFYLSKAEFVDALCFLSAKRKIPVRLFIDEEMAKPAQAPMLQKLRGHGVHIFSENLANRGKLHLKCVVIDRETVITGTYNWTTRAGDNVEDTIVIESPELAQHYTALFSKLANSFQAYEDYAVEQSSVAQFPQGETEKDSYDTWAAPKVKAFEDIQSAEVYFTPGREGWGKFLDQARAATNRILITKYLLKDETIVSNLCDLARAKTFKIGLIVDKGMLDGGDLVALQKLWDAGIDIVYMGDDREIMHMKAVVIDDRYVWTGSANWTKGAMDCNVEDAVCLESPSLGEYYAQFWEQLKARSASFAPMSMNVLLGTANQSNSVWAGSPDPAYSRDKDVPPTANNHDIIFPPTGLRTNYHELFPTARTGAPPMELIGRVEYIDDGEYRDALLKLIRDAESSILITLYEMQKEDDSHGTLAGILNELRAAQKRGVYVYVLLNTPGNANNELCEDHSYWAETLRGEGLDVRLHIPNRDLHEKMIIVDSSKMLVGSHNWSPGALTGERVYESSALIELSQPDQRLNDYVMSLQIIQDMRSRKGWEREISLIRILEGTSSEEREALIQRVEAAMGSKFCSDGIEYAVGEIPRRDTIPSLQQSSSITLLPTEAFGQAALKAIQSAEKSIWIMTYYMSGSRASPVKEIYETLKAKAQAGLDVVIVVEASHGTVSSIKDDTLNFAKELAASGIKVLFVEGKKVQHKKVMIVDEKTVLLGSSNLTSAGTYWSREMNMRSADSAFVADATRDFQEMAALAVPVNP